MKFDQLNTIDADLARFPEAKSVAEIFDQCEMPTRPYLKAFGDTSVTVAGRLANVENDMGNTEEALDRQLSDS